MKLLPPAPKGFCSAHDIEWARLSATPPAFAARQHKRTGRRLQGVKYEALVQDMLLASYGDTYLPSPWLQFKGGAGHKWCQPDGLLIDIQNGSITIVEIKYQHTTDAWWQLRRLYEPVLTVIFPRTLWTYHTLELVKWYDGAVIWPEPIRLIPKPHEATLLPQGSTGIHIWKP